jgi:serine/threonine protein kinase
MTDALPNQRGESTALPLAEPSAFVGRVLRNKYSIEAVLGRGGFGIAFLARNIYLPGHPRCVIKKLAPKFSNPANITAARWRFYLEARSLGRLSGHCQIPTLMDYFKIGNEIYLVQQYIPGSNLAQIVSGSRRFNEAEIENLLIHILRLLSYIHGHRIIHRDIKPQNILLSDIDRRLVLVDFGAVKDLDPPAKAKHYQAAERAIGTPGYAAPEQLANHPVYASDIYSLGMTCLYLLTGKSPSQIATDPQTSEIVWDEHVPLSPSLKSIIDKMVKISPADRYRTATEVLNDLDNRSLRAKLQQFTQTKQQLARSPLHPTNAAVDNPFEQIANYPPAVQWAISLIFDED